MTAPINATPADKPINEPLSVGSHLCTRCGLCCLGVIHQAAVLDEDEIEGARQLGLPVLDREKPGFALPCPRLVERCCTIYEQRPRVCGRYKCQLLQDVEGGKVAVEEALDTIGTAHEALARAMTALPEGMSFATAAMMVRSGDGEFGASEAAQLSPDQRLQIRLQTMALGQFLDRHFRNERDGKLFDVTPVNSNSNEEFE